MTKFESGVKVVPASQEAVYEKLSDLSNLEKVKDRLPEDKVKNLSFDAESMTIEVLRGKDYVADCGEGTLQVYQVCNNHFTATLQSVDTDCTHHRNRMQNETDHRHGYKSVYEDHGAETLAGRIGEDGRYVGDDTILITNH